MSGASSKATRATSRARVCAKGCEAGRRLQFRVALYEYRCPEGHLTEVFHRMGETPAVRCEVCGAATERIMSSPNIHTQYYFSSHVRGAKKPGRQPPTQTSPTESS